METKNLGERSKHQLMSLASRIKAIQHAMTAEELAELLCVSRLTILRRAKRGTIPSFRGMFSELRFIVQVQANALIVFVTELRRNDFKEFRVIDIADAVEI